MTDPPLPRRDPDLPDRLSVAAAVLLPDLALELALDLAVAVLEWRRQHRAAAAAAKLVLQ